MGLILLLLVVALVLFLCAAFGIGGRVALGWLGLAVFMLAQIVGIVAAGGAYLHLRL